MTRLIALSLLVYTACASSEAGTTSPAPSKAQPASTAASMQDLCVQSFTRNRTCTADYIPDLVDTRAKLDKPAGIAEEVKADRAGVIAKANAEWAEDGKDENIARNCQQITAHMNPDDPHLQGMSEQVNACLAKADCTSYVACMHPIQEQMLAGPHP